MTGNPASVQEQDSDISTIFNPKTVAVIGASRDPDKIGYQIVLNLKDGGFTGRIIPVNPKADEILGIKCYPSLKEVSGEIELAILAIPAKYTPAAAKECADRGVHGIIVVASGFSEVGNNKLEADLANAIKGSGTRLLGPNVVGVMNNTLRMNASFGPYLPYPGKIGMVSQSGAMIIALDARTWVDRIGMSYLVSIGNMADLNFSDLIRFLESNEDTSCISLYVEGIKDGRNFIDTAKVSKKPIVMLKSGRSIHGSIAASSHTGSLAGSDKVYDGAMKQAGILRANTIDDLFDKSLALSLQPTMKGSNMLIITNGGGIGVLATDAGEMYGVPVETPSDELRQKLSKYMPEFGSSKNPIDLTAMASGSSYQDAVRTALDDDGVDGLVVLYCEVSNLDPQNAAKGILKGKLESKNHKPMCVGFVGGEQTHRAIEWLQKNEIPSYPSPEKAVMAMSTLRQHEILNQSVCVVNSEARGIDKKGVTKLIEEAGKAGTKTLNEMDSKRIFNLYGIGVNHMELARNENELQGLASKFKFPVAMKIQSPDITHKFDVGGVKLNINSPAEMLTAFRDILASVREKAPAAKIDGIVIEDMMKPGLETIVGTLQDPTFGPTVMFGMGGTNVEVLGDVSFRVAPICDKDAASMISETMVSRLFRGTRGRNDLDSEAVKDTLIRLSWLAVNHPEIKEIDANPVIVYEKGAVAADARIILR
jgi:acetyltransferase